MTEFCKCGSMIFEGNCTNKNCTYKTDKAVVKKTRATKSKTPKTTSTRRSSKVITYNLYETDEENKEEDAL